LFCVHRKVHCVYVGHKQSPVPPSPPSLSEGPRILQQLKDVVVQIVELPLYIPSSLAFTKGHPLIVGMTKFLSCTEGTPALLRVALPTLEDGRPVRSRSFAHLNQHLAAPEVSDQFSPVCCGVPRSLGRGLVAPAQSHSSWP
jgi:hypothetical protein